jgi:hypothetical protein
MVRCTLWVGGIALSGLLLCTGGCTKKTKSHEVSEPIARDKAKAGSQAVPAVPAVPATPAPAAKPAKPVDDRCRPIAQAEAGLPVVAKGKNLVLTKLMKPCITLDGRRGAEKESTYLAMGFPCTGGSGRVEIKGRYHNPNMVTILFGTDCPMAPPTKELAEAALEEALGVPQDLRLLQVTPFVVQYWEIPGMSDADVGFGVELRSSAAREGLWRKLQQQDAVRVRLYGRENTWAQGEHFFQVDADVKLTARTAFSVQVVSVTALKKGEILKARERCEALEPRRNCSAVF